MAEQPFVYMDTTEVTVSALPPEHIDRDVFSVQVVARDLTEGRWAVVRLSDCLSRGGVWDYEPSPSSRTKKWKKAHRFTYDEALAMAEKVVPTLRMNGHVVQNGELVRADAPVSG